MRDNLLLKSDGQLYSKKYNMRESCFTCKYKTVLRIADIAIGDCWGIADIAPDFENKNGVSQVWLNSNKGKVLWEKVSSGFEIQATTVDAVLPYNPALVKPAEKPNQYGKFWSLYKKAGYKKILKHYTYYGLAYRTFAKLKKVIMGLLRSSKGS